MKPLFLICRAGLLAVLAAGNAHAACTLTLAPATLSFGTSRPMAALPPADLPGWRLLGRQSSTLTGVCDAPQRQLRLRFTNVQRAATEGLLLLAPRPASAAAGAMRLRAQDARAANAAVLLSIEGASAASAASAAPAAWRDITEPASVLVLHLPQPLPAGAAFSVQLHMTGMLPHGFNPSQLTSFSASPSVELLP